MFVEKNVIQKRHLCTLHIELFGSSEQFTNWILQKVLNINGTIC